MTGGKGIDNTPPPQAVESFPIHSLAQRPWLLAALLIILTFVAYKPAWRAGFIWDDDDHLTANPVMTAPDGLVKIWSSVTHSRYYPLTLTTFWCERHLWGLNPLPYHLVNVAFHAINGLLVFLLLRRLRVPAAWLAAAVWVLHPVNVESVAWITELKNTQSGLFFFGAWLCYLRFDAEEKRFWYALALLFGTCAFLSKASTVILPLVLLLCVWWKYGRWQRRDVVRVLPFFVLATLVSILAIVDQRGDVARQGAAEWSLGIGPHLLLPARILWFYLGKIVWPVNLAFVYPRWNLAANSVWPYLPLAGLLAVTIILWKCRQQPWARAAIFGLGFFVMALLPVLGFFDVFYFRYSFVADHFQYLASLGVIACGTGGLARVLHGKQLASIIYAMLLMILAGLTWQQSHIYHDQEALWRDTVAKNPNSWMPHYNLGEALWQAGHREEAITQYQQALQLNPNSTEAHFNLGLSLYQLDRLPEAMEQYGQALRLKPDYIEAHYNLGNALWRTGRLEDAMYEYKQALRVEPDYVKAHNNLGIILAHLGHFQEVIEHYEQVVQLAPEQPSAHFNLGLAELQFDKPAEAAMQFKEVLQLQPDYAAAHCNLGNALLLLGQFPEAIEQFKETLRLQPDYEDAHFNMGKALAASGKLADAQAEYEGALRQKPNDAEAHNALGLVFFQLGEIPEAEAQYRTAININAFYVDAHYNLGMALEQMGNIQEALEQYQQAARIQPGLPKLQSALARLQGGQSP